MTLKSPDFAQETERALNRSYVQPTAMQVEVRVFTGLVERLGTVRGINVISPGKRFTIDIGEAIQGVELGASIAVNGCCLTVISQQNTEVDFEAGEETLSRTNLGELKLGDRVNIERSLRLGDSLGGHLVTGHIDAIGRLQQRFDDGTWFQSH